MMNIFMISIVFVTLKVKIFIFFEERDDRFVFPSLNVFILYSLSPVSYTHLDVYKRQAINTSNVIFLYFHYQILQNTTRHIPVSYTHLDVYKRQILGYLWT